MVNREPILGSLEALPMLDADWHTAWVRATGLGKAVLAKVNELEVRHPEIEIIWKTLMPFMTCTKEGLPERLRR